MAAQVVRSPLKWAGSKAGILSHVLPRLPVGGRLIEPCVGSGSVFLNTAYRSYLLSDINGHLVEFYTALRDHGARLISECATLFDGRYNNRDAYEELRAQFNGESRRAYSRPVLFLYLNRHGFNGLCRYNQGGGFNVPFGRFERPYFPERELLGMSARLQGVPIVRADFEVTIRTAGLGDVVYIDPPYTPLSDTENFTAYTPGGFTDRDHRRMIAAASEANRRGATVIISNHDTPETRRLYAEAKLYRFKVRRSISSNAEQRGEAPELIAMYSPRLLHLNLKGEYFDQIVEGSKTEEFRLVSKWRGKLQGKTYDGIVLKRGYPRSDDADRMLLRPWAGCERRKITHPEFGPKSVDVYAIRVGS